MRTSVWRSLFLVLVAAFLGAPLAIVTGVSFNHTTLMVFPPQHPGFVWYRIFFSDPAWMAALERSLGIAIAAALLSTSVALPVSYAIWRYNARLAKLLHGLGLIAFILPPVVIAIVFLVFWSWIGYPGHIEDVAVSHAVVFVALPLATLALGFRSVDPALVEAARTMGAREGDVARTVLLPIILPSIVSGIIFVFVLSLNEYIIAYMVAGFAIETLPIKVMNSLRMGFQPTMCVGAVVFMVIGVAGFAAIAAVGDLPKLLGARR